MSDLTKKLDLIIGEDKENWWVKDITTELHNRYPKIIKAVLDEVERKIDEYEDKIIFQGAIRMDDVYVGKMNAIIDLKQLIKSMYE